MSPLWLPGVTTAGLAPSTPLPTQQPQKTDNWRWATVTTAPVTANSALRIRLDGDVGPLGIAPDFLCRNDELVVGARVWVQIINRRIVVLGIANRIHPELPGSIDLNDITVPGDYYQSHTADAASGTNYPAAIAGWLEVSAPGSNMVWQRYTPYGVNSTVSYTRARYNSSWSAWSITHSSASDDTGWVTASSVGFAGDYASLTGGIVRRRNGMVAVQLTGVLSGILDNTNRNLWSVPSGWIPGQSNGHIGAGPSSAGWQGYASTGGFISSVNVFASIASGSTVQAMGTYML